MTRPAKIAAQKTQTIVLPPNATPARKIDIQKAIDLRCKGLSYQEIANYFGVAKPSVYEALQPYLADITIDIDTFKKNRGDLFASYQAKLLNALTTEDIEKMGGHQKIVGAAILYDKERLETGLSTSNHAHLHLIQGFTPVVSAAGLAVTDDEI